MHQIFSIAKFELSKKKVALRPSAIIGLLVVLFLFIGAFFLLSHYSYRPQHAYYVINPTSGPLDAYVGSASLMRLSTNGSIHAFERADGSYSIEVADRFAKSASISALIDEVKRQNRELILSSGISPRFLVLLNITTRHREEILASPSIPAGNDRTQDGNDSRSDYRSGEQSAMEPHGHLITQTNKLLVIGTSTTNSTDAALVSANDSASHSSTSSSRVTNSSTARPSTAQDGVNSGLSPVSMQVIRIGQGGQAEDSATSNADGGVGSVARVGVMYTDGIDSSSSNTDNVNTNINANTIDTLRGPRSTRVSSLRSTVFANGASAAINASSMLGASGGQSDGLTYPDDVNTLVGVKHLFILIELMLVFNFFAALSGNSFFEEKINYRSSMLFSLPLPKRFVVIGKMLPYLLMSLFFALVLIGVQYRYLLVQPLLYFVLVIMALLYFSVSFLNGLLARSNKEYSFLNVFTTSILSLYLLIPAFIANYSTLGYASLLTPILLLAQQQTIDVSLVVFLGTTYAALALVIFVMGAALWNFEHLYKYDSPFNKLLYIIRTSTKSAWQYIVYGICCVPFLWLAQIILIALFLIIPIDNKLFLLLFGAALSEEFVRNLAVRAHILHARKSPVPITGELAAWKQALYIGIGFGLAEKAILLVSIAPYLNGYEFIVTTGILIPIALHTLFTYLFSLALRKLDVAAAHPNLVCAFLALVHSSFNFLVISYFGVKLI